MVLRRNVVTQKPNLVEVNPVVVLTTILLLGRTAEHHVAGNGVHGDRRTAACSRQQRSWGICSTLLAGPCSPYVPELLRWSPSSLKDGGICEGEGNVDSGLGGDQ